MVTLTVYYLYSRKLKKPDDKQYVNGCVITFDILIQLCQVVSFYPVNDGV